MSANDWIAIGTWLLFSATLLGAILVIVTLNNGHKETKRANDRAKKQATINFYAETLEHRITWQADFPHPRQRRAVAAMLEGLKEQPETKETIALKNKLHAYLAFWELTAVALLHDVFDEQLFKDLLKGHFLAVADGYLPFISDARAEFEDPDGKLYENLEELADAWRENVALTPAPRRGFQRILTRGGPE